MQQTGHSALRRQTFEPAADGLLLNLAQAQFVPLDFGGHMFLELDYFAGPGGLGVQGVIGDCPTALMDWSSSLQWCVLVSCPQGNILKLTPWPTHAAASMPARASFVICRHLVWTVGAIVPSNMTPRTGVRPAHRA